MATAANEKYEPTLAFGYVDLWGAVPVRSRFELRAGCVWLGEEGCEGGAQGEGAEADPGAGSAEALEAVHNDGLHVEIARSVRRRDSSTSAWVCLNVPLCSCIHFT